jgi:hypothetical protein
VTIQINDLPTFTVVAANCEASVNGSNGACPVKLGTSASPIVVAPGDQGRANLAALTQGRRHEA